MDNLDRQSTGTELDQALTAYADTLKTFISTPEPSFQQIVTVLRSRDRLQAILASGLQPDDEFLVKLVELDSELKRQANILCHVNHTEQLNQLRQTLQPPEQAWWWHLEPISDQPPSKPLLARLDWLWNVGTVTCLVIATSFITQTAKAFSTEGFDFLGTLSTISQGAGLAVIAGGTLTDKGKQALSNILGNLKVPPSFHAEVTFGASLLFLGTTYAMNQNLPLVGNWYFAQGQQHEQKGEWSQAFKSYKRALSFAPDDYKTQIAIGFLNERLSNFDQAIEAYKKGSAFGIPEFWNAQARAMLMGELQKNDWQGGIDEKIIRDAENLLRRAERSMTHLRLGSSGAKQNSRLLIDIKINQAIAKLAKIKPAKKLDRTHQAALDSAIGSLASIKNYFSNGQPESSSELTLASTIGSDRAECFYHQADKFGRLIGSSIYGMDPTVASMEGFYACSPFIMSSLSMTADALLIQNYKFSEDQQVGQLFDSSNITEFWSNLYTYPYYEDFGTEPPEAFNRIALIKEPAKWLALADQLSKLIQKHYAKDYTPGEAKENLIWRILVSKSGEMIGYLTYDPISSSIAETQSFFTKLRKNKIEQLISSNLQSNRPFEFADFKVFLSPSGKILHILPWALAYPSESEICKKKCKHLALNPQVSLAFKRYSPNWKDSVELNTLRAVIYKSLDAFAVNTKTGWYSDKPAVFKLKVSADGQIVDYQAINQLAIQKFGKEFPFQGLKPRPSPENQQAPYADFKLEIRGVPYQLTPWPARQ